MSVSDLVAYLVGWNELVLKWMDRDAAGKPIDYPDSGFNGNELGKLAQKFCRDYEDIPYLQLLDLLQEAKLHGRSWRPSVFEPVRALLPRAGDRYGPGNRAQRGGRSAGHERP